MARMRLIKTAFQQLKEEDPNTAVTLCGLRRLVLSGEIPSVTVGRKRLIDYDNLLSYLGKAVPVAEKPVRTEGEIRRIS